MKKINILKKISCLFLCAVLMSTNTITAESDLTAGMIKVYATYNEERKDVTCTVMEVEGSVMAPIAFEVDTGSEIAASSYRLVQYRASDQKVVDLAKSSSPSFSIYASDMVEGIPLYLGVYDSKGNCVVTQKLYIRVNHGAAADLVVPSIASEYQSAITVPMDELLPGMKFEMHPYLIPTTAKAYTDGRFIIGIGINSTNTSFWKDAATGKLGTGTSEKELAKAFWGKTENKKAVEGSNMGLLFEFSGWVQGNMNEKDELKGELSAFVGTGFDVTGQYLILTWEVTVTGGASGVFDFHLKYNDQKKKYSDLEVDKAGFGVKAGLELYGGLGLSSVASLGIYGAGSVAGYSLIYPKAAQDSLVLAGECGFKVKLFSRTLFSYAVVSGTYDFIRKTGGSLMNIYQQDQLGDYLLAHDYASYSPPIDEPDTTGQWYTDGDDPESGVLGSLQGYENDKDFAHLVAENIYPDNRLQIVHHGRNHSDMSVVFLGSDPSRSNGNRSRLMNIYYMEATDYLADPSWINEDDGTADYDPYVYHGYSIYSEASYIVWRNALEQLDENATLEEISRKSDICFAQHQWAGYWKDTSRVTFYADEENDVFAAGAKVSEDGRGEPVVSYYLNRTSDPAGLDDTYTHEVHTARRNEEGNWEDQNEFSVTGSISELVTADFNEQQMIAVSYSYRDENGDRNYRVELWDDDEIVFERENAHNARFVRVGYDDRMLVWLEDGRLWCIYESDLSGIHALTPEDVRIPGSDYQISARYGSNMIYLLGTGSKEGSEDAFTIASTNGGTTWNKVELTSIGGNALVNELSIASTNSDEPILFYSVKHYENNFDESLTDAENFLQGEQNPSFEGLQAIMIGADDPRFSDLQTDLYVKARRANQRVRISDVEFTDEDGARKGQSTPVSMEIENVGLYPIGDISIYENGEKIADRTVNLNFGEKKTIEFEYTVPSDAENQPIHVVYGVSSHENVIENEKEAVLGTGHLTVKYDHSFIYAEGLQFIVANNGFAAKEIRTAVYDADTGECLQVYPVFVPAGVETSSSYSLVSGLWIDKGHKNLRGCVYEVGEDPESLDSTRFVTIRGLEKIYEQDISRLPLKDTNDNEPEPTPEKEEEPYVPAVVPTTPYNMPNTYVTEEPQHTERPETVKEENETVRPQETVKEENTVPQLQEEPVEEKEEENGKQNGFLFYVLAACALGLLLLVFFLFWLFRRRNEEEE